MNAVATPTLRTTAKTAKKTGAATKPSTSLSLLEAIRGDLQGARATITQIANSIGPMEADVGLLLDMAAGGVGRSVEYLQSASLTGAACEDARGETAQTCALLRGAASLAKGMEVDIHSPSIISVCELVDESDNNLDRLSIDLSLSANIEPCTSDAAAGSEVPYSIPAWRAVISEVGGIHQAAQHILAAQIDYMDSSAAFGVLALVERLSQLVDGAYNEAEESLSDHVSGYFSRLSDEYLIVVDVASAVNRDGIDDLTLWAVIHLLNGCKRLVDDHVDSLMEAFQAGKAGGADHA